MTEREQDLHPVPANACRARRLAGMHIREASFRLMRQGIDAGLAFPDAAEAAKIPYEYVLAALAYDADIRAWFAECVGRKSLIRSEDAHLIPETKSTMQLKRETANKIFAAGLGDRFAETAAHLQPINEDGSFNKEHVNVMMHMGKLTFPMLPHETENANREAPPEEEKPRTEQVVMQELVELREKRLRREADEQHALEARESGGRSLEGPAKRDAS